MTVHAVIDPQKREALLRAMRDEGLSLKDACAAVALPRSSVYLERSRDAAFARAIDEARRPPEPEQELVPYDGEAPLPRETIGAFVRALHKTGSVQQAALRAGVDLHPRRIAPKDVPPEARRLIRDALDIIGEASAPKPQSAEERALAAWLEGKDWPLHGDDELDVAALRRLSARAADSLERWRAAQASVIARAERPKRRRPPDDGPVF